MTTKRLLITFTLGLGLTLALLWSVNGAPLPTARAATFTVTNTGDSGAGSLRQVLALAGDGDTIDFSLTYPATITLSSELIVSESITIAGPGAGQLFISGNDANRVFNVTGESVTLQDLTVTRGRVSTETVGGGGIYYENISGTLLLSDVVVFDNSAEETNGGGVYVREGSVTLNGGQIISNSAEYGGGVCIWNGKATLNGGQIISNSATDNGGGVFVAWSIAAFTQTGGSTIAGNTADSFGGGVYLSYGRATLNGGQIVSNSAYQGGGVCVFNSSTVFTQTGGSTIAGNTADYGGGGVYVWLGKATLNGGQIISNSAPAGGGVYIVGEIGSFIQTGDSTIAGNTAERGGGVQASNGRATLSGGQIINNSADITGGGVYLSSPTSAFTQTGGTIAGNTAGSSGGGLYTGHGRVTLSGGQIINNSASVYGGGVWVGHGGATLSGGHIINSNSASDCGGGLYVGYSNVMLNEGQITGNSAPSGGGVCLYKGGATLNGGQIAANNAPEGSALSLIHADAAVTTTVPFTLGGDVYQSDGDFYGSDHDLQIEGALSLIGGTFHAPTSFDLTGVFSHTGGTYYQTRSVTGSGDVGFPKAGGVILNANSQDLGNTQVAITAGELCTGTSAGNAVKHCYVITPTNATGRDATVTFYYRDDEIPPGHACSLMQAHRWDGSWAHVLTRDAAYGSDGRMCGSDPQSIRVTNVTTFSPFALRGPLFNFAAQPDHLIANGADKSKLTVSAPPFFAGRVVTFTWNMGYFVSPVTDTINASGVASYTYVAGNFPGTDVVTATVYDEVDTKTATATIQLDSSPLLGSLSSVHQAKLITYTFVVTNVGIVTDTNVVMTGSIPANTELVWVDNGILVPTGGDYGWGYVATITYPQMGPGEAHVLAWSVRTLMITGDIFTQAHARSDQNILRLPLQDRVYRVLLPFIWRNAKF